MLKRLFLVKIAVILFFAAPALGGKIIARAENEEQTRAIVTETSTDEFFNYRANNLLVIPKDEDFLGEIICEGYVHSGSAIDNNFVKFNSEKGQNAYIYIYGYELKTISGRDVVSINENTRIQLTNSSENYIILLSGRSVDYLIENMYYIITVSKGIYPTFAKRVTDIIPNAEEFYITSVQVYKDSREKVGLNLNPPPYDSLDWSGYDFISPYPYFNIGLNGVEARRKLALMPTAIIINKQNRDLYYNCEYAIMSTASTTGTTNNTQSAVENFSAPQNIKYQFSSYNNNNYYGIFQKDSYFDEIDESKSIILEKNASTAYDNINNISINYPTKFSVLSACTGQYYSFDGEAWYGAKCGIASDTDVQNSIAAFDSFQNCVSAFISKDVHRVTTTARQDWSTPGGVINGVFTGLFTGIALFVLGPAFLIINAAYDVFTGGNLSTFTEFVISIWNNIYSIIEPVTTFLGNVLEAGGKIIESVADFLKKNLPGVLTFIGDYWWALLILAGIIFVSILITRWRR